MNASLVGNCTLTHVPESPGYNAVSANLGNMSCALPILVLEFSCVIFVFSQVNLNDLIATSVQNIFSMHAFEIKMTIW